MAEPKFWDKTRAATLDIATTILNTDGLPQLQARKVALAANCSVGTLYNIWGSLDGLIIAANSETLTRLGERLIAARDEAGSSPGIEQRLLALAGAYVSFAIDNQKAWRSLFEHHMAPKQKVPEWYRDAQRGLFDIVEAALEPFVSDASGRARAARALFASVHGIVSLALDEKLSDFDRTDCDAQVRFIVLTAARGLERGGRDPAALANKSGARV